MSVISPANSREGSDTPELPPASHDLWRRYHSQGGTALEDDLVREYLPLVRLLVGRMTLSLPAHVSADDLYSAGMIGLLQAIRNFDPDCRCSFETYARRRIRGAVLDELRRLDWAPRSVHEKARAIERVLLALGQQLGRLPSEEEMAAAMGCSVSDYLECLDGVRAATFVCLDAAGPDQGEDYVLGEAISDVAQDDPAEQAARLDQARVIAEHIRWLPENHRKVLALYYFEDLQLKEIAAVLGLSESRICQIHAQAILSIRAYLVTCDVSPHPAKEGSG